MGDTEFLRLAAEEAEFKRVKERLTLKHKNTSQWARRALRRGINVMDEGMPLGVSHAFSMPSAGISACVDVKGMHHGLPGISMPAGSMHCCSNWLKEYKGGPL